MSRKSKKKVKSNSNSNNPVTLETLQHERLANSLTALVYGTAGGNTGTQVSQLTTLFQNNRWQLLSNMRQVLSQLYVEHGIVQTLIDQPVDDALRGEIKILSEQLSDDEIDELKHYVDKENIKQELGQALKWMRLYGGGALLVITGQKSDTPLSALDPDSKLKFRAVDMWELYFTVFCF